MQLLDLLTEKLAPSIYRKYVKNWDKDRYKDIFLKYPHDRNAYRIYLNIDSSTGLPPDNDVLTFIKNKGYDVHDYSLGLAKKGNRVIKIGKIIDDQNIKKKYDNDPARTATRKELMVVISRHPYDITGMSTDRGWNSCMNLDVAKNPHQIGTTEFIPVDIKEGTLVAYLINAQHQNITGQQYNSSKAIKSDSLANPIARVLIKPYINMQDPKKVLLGVEDKIYGSAPIEFKNTVLNWVNKINGNNSLYGTFKFNEKLYDDFKTKNNTSKEEVYKKWKIIGKTPEENSDIAKVTEDYTNILEVDNITENIVMSALLDERGFKFVLLNGINMTELNIISAFQMHPGSVHMYITLLLKYKKEITNKIKVEAAKQNIRSIPILINNDIDFSDKEVNNIIKYNLATFHQFVRYGYENIDDEITNKVVKHYNDTLEDALEIGANLTDDTILSVIRKDPYAIYVLPDYNIKVTKEMKKLAQKLIDSGDFDD